MDAAGGSVAGYSGRTPGFGPAACVKRLRAAAGSWTLRTVSPAANVSVCGRWRKLRFCQLLSRPVAALHARLGSIPFTRTISESLLDVLLQGARKIAEDPGAPGMWPMVLAHLVPFTVVAFSAMDASTQQSLALRCCTLLDCGLQLVNDEPPLATREAIAVHGASASAESALAAVLALYTVLMLNSISVATAPSLIRLGQLCPAAVRALAQLMQRCTAQLSEPAASLMLLLPSPQQLLYPRDNYLQA